MTIASASVPEVHHENHEETLEHLIDVGQTPSLNRSALLRSSIHLCLFGSLTLMVTTPLLLKGVVLSSVGFYLPLCLIFSGLLALEGRGYDRFAGWALCLILFAAVCAGIFFFGGIQQQTAVAFVTVIIMAALNIGPTAALLFGALSGLAVLSLVEAGQMGLTPTALILFDREDLTFSILLNLGIVSLLMRRVVSQANTATEGLEIARKNHLINAASLKEIHRRTKERSRFARKISEVAEGVIHGEFDTWRPRTLRTVQGMFDATAVGLSETPSGADSHLTAWVGELEWGKESTWERFHDRIFEPDPEPFVYLSRSHDPEAFRNLPAGTDALFVISIPGRSHGQGKLIIVLKKPIEVSSSFSKDIQTLRSIIGSSIERSAAEQKMRIAQRMETVGRLAGTIAHDFNNLLTTIMGCSQLLAEDKDEDDTDHELLTDISRAADHAALLTRQLLVLSRKQVVLVSPVDINQAIQEFCRMADRMVGEKIQVDFQAREGATYVLADPSNIEQILLNLTVNARDAMPEGGRIRLSLERYRDFDKRRLSAGLPEERDFLLLKFSDTGSGMSPHVLSHLFEPFFTTKRSGTGLGLASVQEVVDALGGRIEVVSTPMSGTTFSIFIPEEHIDASNSRERTEPPVSTSSSGAGERILLVDDNDHVRRTLSRVLATAGFSVSVAHSGLDALAVLERSETSFDLILTDIIMPAVSGIDLASRLRERGISTPILFMSGFADSNQREIGALGNFISKPFTACQILTRIGLILSSEEPDGDFSNFDTPRPGQAGQVLPGLN